MVRRIFVNQSERFFPYRSDWMLAVAKFARENYGISVIGERLKFGVYAAPMGTA
ncbi:MAG: hypothetical protein ACREO5_10060 [Candidatus Binatia bacterium]